MFVTSVLLILSIVVPFWVFLRGKRTKRRLRAALIGNAASFFGIILMATLLMFTTAAAEGEMGLTMADSIKMVAAALSTGMASIGAGIAVSSSASAAIGAMSENDKIMGKALIFVALAEGIALYGLLVSFTILG